MHWLSGESLDSAWMSHSILVTTFSSSLKSFMWWCYVFKYEDFASNDFWELSVTLLIRYWKKALSKSLKCYFANESKVQHTIKQILIQIYLGISYYWDLTDTLLSRYLAITFVDLQSAWPSVSKHWFIFIIIFIIIEVSL